MPLCLPDSAQHLMVMYVPAQWCFNIIAEFASSVHFFRNCYLASFQFRWSFGRINDCDHDIYQTAAKVSQSEMSIDILLPQWQNATMVKRRLKRLCVSTVMHGIVRLFCPALHPSATGVWVCSQQVLHCFSGYISYSPSVPHIQECGEMPCIATSSYTRAQIPSRGLPVFCWISLFINIYSADFWHSFSLSHPSNITNIWCTFQLKRQ